MKRAATSLFVLFAALLPVVGGCTAEVGEGVLELGTGEWRYEPIASGEDVELIRGVQGGVHVWLSMRAVGLDPEGVTMEIVTEKVDGSFGPEESIVEIDLYEPEDTSLGMHEVLGWPAVLSQPGCVVDSELRVSVTLTDRDGVSATDERIMIPRGTDMPACSL